MAAAGPFWIVRQSMEREVVRSFSSLSFLPGCDEQTLLGFSITFRSMLRRGGWEGPGTISRMGGRSMMDIVCPHCGGVMEVSKSEPIRQGRRRLRRCKDPDCALSITTIEREAGLPLGIDIDQPDTSIPFVSGILSELRKLRCEVRELSRKNEATESNHKPKDGE